jgi:hypothetical protein
MSAEVWLIAAG